MHEQTRSVMEYILDAYGVELEYPWAKSSNGIWRNPRTKKWFAVLLSDLPLRSLGLAQDGMQDVLNLKCDPTFSLVDHLHIFRDYHMNKEHWISVLLDGTMPVDELVFLVDRSWRLVDNTGRKRNGRNEG